MSIPDEAVEAAAKRLWRNSSLARKTCEAWEGLDAHEQSKYRADAAEALDAAAPHILKDISKARKGDLFRFTWAQRAWLRHNPYRSQA